MLRPHSPFYNKTIRSYVVSFANLFNELYIQHFDDTGAAVRTIQVPIAFTKKEKYIQRLQQTKMEGDEEHTQIQMTLPRMAFDLVTPGQYDTERKLNTLNKWQQINPADTSGSTAQSMYQPIPWNFEFELYITTRQVDEMYQIVEQILPWFTPFFMLSIRDNANFATSTDVPLVFNGISQEDSWTGDMGDEERRLLIWTLSFTLKGHLYGPTTTLPLIKQAETNITGFDCVPLQTTIVTPDPPDAGPNDDYDFNVLIIDYD